MPVPSSVSAMRSYVFFAYMWQMSTFCIYSNELQVRLILPNNSKYNGQDSNNSATRSMCPAGHMANDYLNCGNFEKKSDVAWSSIVESKKPTREEKLPTGHVQTQWGIFLLLLAFCIHVANKHILYLFQWTTCEINSATLGETIYVPLNSNMINNYCSHAIVLSESTHEQRLQTSS